MKTYAITRLSTFFRFTPTITSTIQHCARQHRGINTQEIDAEKTWNALMALRKKASLKKLFFMKLICLAAPLWPLLCTTISNEPCTTSSETRQPPNSEQSSQGERERERVQNVHHHPNLPIQHSLHLWIFPTLRPLLHSRLPTSSNPSQSLPHYISPSHKETISIISRHVAKGERSEKLGRVGQGNHQCCNHLFGGELGGSLGMLEKRLGGCGRGRDSIREGSIMTTWHPNHRP